MKGLGQRCAEWDPNFFRPLDSVAALTNLTRCSALSLWLAAYLAQLVGTVALGRSKAKGAKALRLGQILESNAFRVLSHIAAIYHINRL